MASWTFMIMRCLKNDWFVNHCEEVFWLGGEASFCVSENHTWQDILRGLHSLKWQKMSKCSFQHWIIPLLASKRQHLMLKHALIGCQMWHDRSSNIWSLTESGANFFSKSSIHEMHKDWTLKTSSICILTMYAFGESCFTSTGLEIYIVFWLALVKLPSNLFLLNKKRFWLDKYALHHNS